MILQGTQGLNTHRRLVKQSNNDHWTSGTGPKLIFAFSYTFHHQNHIAMLVIGFPLLPWLFVFFPLLLVPFCFSFYQGAKSRGPLLVSSFYVSCCAIYCLRKKLRNVNHEVHDRDGTLQIVALAVERNFQRQLLAVISSQARFLINNILISYF